MLTEKINNFFVRALVAKISEAETDTPLFSRRVSISLLLFSMALIEKIQLSLKTCAGYTRHQFREPV
jgi:hypothetical protein